MPKLKAIAPLLPGLALLLCGFWLVALFWSAAGSVSHPLLGVTLFAAMAVLAVLQFLALGTDLVWRRQHLLAWASLPRFLWHFLACVSAVHVLFVMYIFSSHYLAALPR